MQQRLPPMCSSSTTDNPHNEEQIDTMTNSNCQQELERAKADALETAETLEKLVDGIRAVRRILERPIDSENQDKANNSDDTSDISQVSMLSNSLVGVLGSELIGLLNASVMVKGHAKLRIEDDKKVIEELHTSRENARTLGERADEAESMNLRLKAEKKLLVKEVRALREDRKVLVKEVKFTRKLIRETQQLESWRLLQNHLREATMIHESVLNSKTFNHGFGGVDPPGTQVKEDGSMEEQINQDDFAGMSPSSNKENNGELAYSPRIGEEDGNESGNTDGVVKYISKRSPKRATPTKSKVTPTKSEGTPTESKQRGLAFNLDRFRKNKHPGSPTADDNNNSNNNNNNNKSIDDDATKSTRSCSFETHEAANGESMFSSGEGDTTNDLAFQISIDEDSSLCTKPLGDASSPGFMVTPVSLASSTSAQSKARKPLCDPNVLRTLSIPNANTQREASETTTTATTTVKPRVRSFRLRSRA